MNSLTREKPVSPLVIFSLASFGGRVRLLALPCFFLLFCGTKLNVKESCASRFDNTARYLFFSTSRRRRSNQNVKKQLFWWKQSFSNAACTNKPSHQLVMYLLRNNYNDYQLGIHETAYGALWVGSDGLEMSHATWRDTVMLRLFYPSFLGGSGHPGSQDAIHVCFRLVNHSVNIFNWMNRDIVSRGYQ